MSWDIIAGGIAGGILLLLAVCLGAEIGSRRPSALARAAGEAVASSARQVASKRLGIPKPADRPQPGRERWPDGATTTDPDEAA